MASNMSLMVKLGVDPVAFEKGLNRAASKMQKFGSQMKSAGRTMSMSVTAPITALGVVTLKTAGDFEAAMNKVQAVSGATGQQFEALKEQARDLGATTQFSATQAADAMTFLSMAGFEANEILGAMPATLNLAAAAQLDMGSAADIVSNIMAGFNMTSDELAGAVDVLAKQFTTSNTNLSQLGEAMKFAAPVASSLGVSIEESAAAIGVLSDAGLQASMAGTGLRRILSTLAQRSDELGISVYNSDGTLRGFADIMADLEKQGLSTSRVMEVFGERGGPALLALLSAGSGAIREQTEVLKDAGGTAEDIAKTQMKGLNGAMKALRSAAEELMLAIGDSGLLQDVTNLAKRFTDFLRGLAETNPEMLRTVTIVAGVAAAMGPLLIIIGQMSIGIGGLVKGVMALTAAIAANPIGAFAIAIGVAVAALQAYRYATKEAATSATALKDVQDEVNSSMAKERIELDSLLSQIKKTNTGSEDRRKLIEKLNAKYGDLIGFTVDETTELGKLKTAYDNIVKAMRQKVTQQVVMAKQEQILAEQFQRSSTFVDDFRGSIEKGNRTLEPYKKSIVDIIQNVDGLVAAQMIYNKVGKDASDTFLAQNDISQDLFRQYQQLESRTVRINHENVNLGKTFIALANAKTADSRAMADLNKLVGDFVTVVEDANGNGGGGGTPELARNLGNAADKATDLAGAMSMLREGMTNFEANNKAMEGFSRLAEDAGESTINLGHKMVSTAPMMQAIADKFTGLRKEAAETAMAISNLVMPAIGGFIDALVSGSGNAFKAFIDGLKQVVVQLVKVAIQAAIVAAIMTAIMPGSAGLTGGQIFGKNFGSVFGGLLGFADGGVPPVGKPSIVGERGPELFVPSTRGTVIPNHMLGGMGGEVKFRIEGRELVGILGREGKIAGRT